MKTVLHQVPHPRDIGHNDLYGLLLEEVRTGIAGSMDDVVIVLLTGQRLGDVALHKMETLVIPIVGKAAAGTFLITSQGIDLAMTLCHQQVRQTTANQSGSPRYQQSATGER